MGKGGLPGRIGLVAHRVPQNPNQAARGGTVPASLRWRRLSPRWRRRTPRHLFERLRAIWRASPRREASPQGGKLLKVYQGFAERA